MVVMDFGDLKTTAGLGKLNLHLQQNSYISGYAASQDDIDVLAQLHAVPCAHPCVKRWMQHVLYFSEAERKLWPKGQGVAGRAAASPAPKASPKEVDDDDDFDPFAEDTETDKATKESLKQKATSVAKPKKVVINKSTLVIEVKPVTTEINLDDVENLVRQLNIEGLEWSKASNKLPVAYGLFKLQIGCTIIDELVNTDDVIEKIETIGLNEADSKRKIAIRDGEIECDDEEEDLGLVQSAEIVSFNKL